MSAKTANKTKKPTMADKADIHELYEESVQNVANEVEFLSKTFRAVTGRTGYLFREDFCGTASLACEWAKQGPEFSAIGVDIDPSVLDWGRKNRVGRLDTADQTRVSLIESNVLTVETPKVDLLAAFNFSYWIFEERATMLNYFRRCFDALKDDGVLFLDMFGGAESFEETREKTKQDGFTYIWDQAEFYPVTNHMQCYIHFKFPDGSKLKRAFSYAWRLWTAPEIRDLLMEAGFSNVTVYWEGEDEDGEGNGEFTPNDKGEADLAWIAYIVAEKR
ncbi:methyltransferase domain-containing protein [Gammaproteobacteria bacterium]|jgi:SAM-dependent methyltransferase|nr:methyltransferase domain-containing protein [Gammaproteobacteria bacterium]